MATKNNLLTPPRYIVESGIIGSPVKQGEIDDNLYENQKNTKLNNQIRKLTFRASMAVGIACTEWCLWKSHRPETFSLPYLYAEAAWAANIDHRYLVHWNGYYKDIDKMPDGPGYGGMHEAIYNLQRLTVNIKSYPPPNYVGNTAIWTRELLLETDKFDQWLKDVMARLSKLYPLVDYDNTLTGEEYKQNYPKWKGMPVPREAFDPAFDFKPEMTNELIANFLSNLDYANNPFLNIPEKMIELGFEGTPYKWQTNKNEIIIKK